MTTMWEVRTTGSDSNGGGFDSSLGGTDYSQQDSPQATGTATSAGTTLTATTGIFTSQMVGNFVTNGTTWAKITAYTSSTVVTLGSSPGWTAQSIKVGGATASWNGLWAILATGISVYKAWIKDSGSDFLVTGDPSGSASVILQGYGSIRGDSGRPTIKLSSGTKILQASGANWSGVHLINLIFDGDSIGSSYGIYLPGQFSNCPWRIENCEFKNLETNFVAMTYSTIERCHFAGGSITVDSASKVAHCTFDNCAVGFQNGGYNVVEFNIFYNCSGTVISLNQGPSNRVVNNTFHGTSYTQAIYLYNGFHDEYRPGTYIARNIIVGATTGIASVFGNSHDVVFDNNAFYGCSTNYDVNSGSSYPFDEVLNTITLSGDPFVNAAGGNFSLNNTAGAGADCRGISYTFPNGTTTSYADIGAVQHQDSGGGGGGNPNVIRRSSVSGGVR